MPSIINLPGEVWKSIPGYEGLYEVSNKGRVKSCEKTLRCRNQCCEFDHTYPEKLLYTDNKQDGYYRVSLANDGKWKTWLTHRLVALAFIPNPENKPEVNHKDRNHGNNCVENLEQVTKEENLAHLIANGWDPRMTRLGKHNTKEHNEKIQAALKPQRQKINRKISTALGHPCRCIETGQIFVSHSEAARVIGISADSVDTSIKYHKQVKGMYTFIGIPKCDAINH